MSKVFSGLCIFVLQSVNCQVGIDNSCTSITGGPGICINLFTCKPFLDVTRGAFSSPTITWLLQKSHCGFDGNFPKVCCPKDNKNSNTNSIDLVTKSITTWRTSTLPLMTSNLPWTTSALPLVTSTLSLTTSTVPPTTSTVPPTTSTVPLTKSILPPLTSTTPPISTSLINITDKRTEEISINDLLLLDALQQKTSSPNADTIADSYAAYRSFTLGVLKSVHQLVKTLKNDKERRKDILNNGTTLPQATNKTSEKVIEMISLHETCITIYNTTGSCIDVYLCEPLLNITKEAPRNPAAARLVKQAHCGFKGTIPQVCCSLPGLTSSLDSSSLATFDSSKENPKRPGEHFLASFPEPPICGNSGSEISRVVGGVPAKLGAFPWMALLGYRDESVASEVRWGCGGSLISSRHVLTAAHCIRQRYELFLVRLGELDLARDDEGATPIDVLIKEKIQHPNYTRNNPVLFDIGVLVLERDVEFTTLISPICLVPAKRWSASSFENFNPFLAGWGNTKWNGVPASHLQVAQVPVLNHTDCECVYSKYLQKSRVLFSTLAMCAGYINGNIDSCAGDSGGPLMLPLANEKFKYYFYEIGVVSFGQMCSKTGSPGVYTRVAAYLPWLEETVLGRTRPADLF